MMATLQVAFELIEAYDTSNWLVFTYKELNLPVEVNGCIFIIKLNLKYKVVKIDL